MKKPRRLLEFCGIDRAVWLYEPEVGDNVYRPLYEVASSFCWREGAGWLFAAVTEEGYKV